MKKFFFLSVLSLLITQVALAAKCYDPDSLKRDRHTDHMVRIENNDIQAKTNAIVNRKTGDRIFLAEIKDNATTEAIASSCNGEGFTPVFQEKLCTTGETITYIIRKQLCIEAFENYADGRLIRNRDERIGFYPFSLTVWTFNDGLSEKIILFPWSTIADVIVLPFSTMIATEDMLDNLNRRVAQRRMEKKLHKKDVKISNNASDDVLRHLIFGY